MIPGTVDDARYPGVPGVRPAACQRGQRLLARLAQRPPGAYARLGGLGHARAHDGVDRHTLAALAGARASSPPPPLHRSPTPTTPPQRLTQCKENNKAAFIGYITGGYPTPADTVPLLKGMEAGGCDVIELGVPFTDPQADGATIQEANKQALAQGTSLPQVVEMVKQARAEGVTAPIMLMGYWNPFLQ